MGSVDGEEGGVELAEGVYWHAERRAWGACQSGWRACRGGVACGARVQRVGGREVRGKGGFFDPFVGGGDGAVIFGRNGLGGVGAMRRRFERGRGEGEEGVKVGAGGGGSFYDSGVGSSLRVGSRGGGDGGAVTEFSGYVSAEEEEGGRGVVGSVGETMVGMEKGGTPVGDGGKVVGAPEVQQGEQGIGLGGRDGMSSRQDLSSGLDGMDAASTISKRRWLSGVRSRLRENVKGMSGRMGSGGRSGLGLDESP